MVASIKTSFELEENNVLTMQKYSARKLRHFMQHENCGAIDVTPSVLRARVINVDLILFKIFRYLIYSFLKE